MFQEIKMINSSKDNKPRISKYLKGSSKAKSITKARTSTGMKGGHITTSGHTIGLTTDQQADFMKKISNAIHDINSDSAFTPEQKAHLIKNLPTMKDLKFYEFLNVQYQSGPALAEYVRQFVSDDRPKHARGPKGTKKE